MLFVTVGVQRGLSAAGIRRGGHLAVSPATEEFEDCHGTVEHFVHGHVWLFCTVAFHELT